MPFLNKRLLKDAVTKHRHLIASAAKQNLQALFKDTLNRIETGKFKKEESEKVPFLQQMFELLGYKLHVNLEFEYSTSLGRSIDAVLGLQTEKGRDVEVAIEWKGIDTKSLDKGKAGETPVSQMWDYMGKVGAEIGIVGNFLEFRIYTLKTKQTEYQEFKLREIVDNEYKLDEFIFLFKEHTLLRNDNKQSLLENLISQSEAEQEQITKRFYNDYKQRRLNLFQHLVENNPETNKHILLEKAQKILDRLIFVMFCEDGLLLPNNILKDTYNLGKNSRSRSETKVWEQLQYLFEDIDKGRYDVNPKINAFNGGLFADDLELNNLIIKDIIWHDLIKLAEYDFQSDLNVNILGHIFEQSINDIEEIKENIGLALNSGKLLISEDGKLVLTQEDKAPILKGKRKKDGIYYTPEYITNYIVSETIGSWLNQESNQLEQIKVLDPAGGSGAFPNQVHNYLAKRHAEMVNQEAKEAGFEGGLAELDETTVDKSILKNNIFMVDLQPESVEIAKLSLWLKTAKKDQKLNNLDGNIKCGDSLIDDPEIAGQKAFNWEKEFPEVMASGGFDVIVGNPPYFNIDTFGGGSPILSYLKNNYSEIYMDKSDILFYFIKRSIDLLKNTGIMGFIISNAFLFSDKASRLRNYILENCTVLEIVNFEQYYVFDSANITSCIFILRKGKSPNNKTKAYNFTERNYTQEYILNTIKDKDNFFEVEFEPNKPFALVNNHKADLNKKIDSNHPKLGELFHIGSGMQTAANEVFGFDRYPSEFPAELIKKRMSGEIIEKYIHRNPIEYLLYFEDEKDFEALPNTLKEHLKKHRDKLENRATVKNEGRSWWKYSRPMHKEYYHLPKIWCSYRAKENCFCLDQSSDFIGLTNTTAIFGTNPDYNLKYILALLNSKLLNNRYRSIGKQTGSGVFEYFENQIFQLPIPKATTEQQGQIGGLVDQIMELKTNSQNLTNSFLNLITAKYKPTTISTKLKNWYKLEITELLDELKKQKAVIGGLSAESELMAYYDEQKGKVVELEKEAERVDGEIEGLVRNLYSV